MFIQKISSICCPQYMSQTWWLDHHVAFAMSHRLLPDGSLEEPTELRLVIRPDGRLEVESEIGRACFLPPALGDLGTVWNHVKPCETGSNLMLWDRWSLHKRETISGIRGIDGSQTHMSVRSFWTYGKLAMNVGHDAPLSHCFPSSFGKMISIYIS